MQALLVMYFFHFYIFPDVFSYWSQVHLHCLFFIYPVFLSLRASMSDASIFPFTISSECSHLIGAYRLWLSDSEFKREHRNCTLKTLLAIHSFKLISLFLSFPKPQNLDDVPIKITEVPLAIALAPGVPTRGPWRYSRGAMEKRYHF